MSTVLFACIALVLGGYLVIRLTSLNKVIADQQTKIETQSTQISSGNQTFQSLQNKYTSLQASYNTLQNTKQQVQYVPEQTQTSQKPVTCSTFGSTYSVTCYNPY
jgi:uncharacterized protein involved in exopolysaccharide biosynthesis